MKILIEGSVLFGTRTGVGQYLKRLLDATLSLDQKNNYIIFAFNFLNRKNYFPIQAKHLKYKFIPFLSGRVYNKLLKFRIAPPIDLLAGLNQGIYLFPNFVSWPVSKGSKKIVVIFDISYLLHPEFSQNSNRRYLKKFVPSSIRQSNHIVTISQNTKEEIVEHYKVNPDTVSIIHPAVDHNIYKPRSRQETDTIKKKYSINGSYILYTGTLEPRKNILGILNAYEVLPDSLKNDLHLVLAGGKGWKDEEIGSKLHQLISSGEKIIHTGYVPDEDLPPLYSGASLFVYPSFYEGFGMPPLEAMACGVPVITSNNSSLPEVVSDAGIVIDANDTEALTKNIEKVLRNSKLAKDLAKKGIEQAKKFTWENSAIKLRDLLEDVGKKP